MDDGATNLDTLPLSTQPRRAMEQRQTEGWTRRWAVGCVLL